MILKKNILFLTLCLGFTELLPNKTFSFSTGAGKVPTTFSFFSLFNNFISTSFAGIKPKWICDSLYNEYKSGRINKNINKYFFDLDDEMAKKIGPKIIKFRSQKGNGLALIRKVANIVNMSLSLKPIRQVSDDASYDKYLKKLKKKNIKRE